MQETKCIGGLSDAKWGSQYHQQDRVYSMGQCALALPASIPEGSYKYMEIKIVGKMDHTMDHTFESANRVYGTEGISPTIPTCAGGNIQPKIVECVAMRTEREGLKVVNIRQATKDGAIPCEVGGDMRFELPGQQNTERTSPGKWTDMPDSDNGEYP